MLQTTEKNISFLFQIKLTKKKNKIITKIMQFFFFIYIFTLCLFKIRVRKKNAKLKSSFLFVIYWSPILHASYISHLAYTQKHKLWKNNEPFFRFVAKESHHPTPPAHKKSSIWFIFIFFFFSYCTREKNQKKSSTTDQHTEHTHMSLKCDIFTPINSFNYIKEY